MAQSPRQDPYADLTEDSIRCRIHGHTWLPYNAKMINSAFETEEHCDQCKSERISKISNRGAVISRRIRYEDGYLSEDGRLEQNDRDMLRLTVLGWDFGVNVKLGRKR